MFKSLEDALEKVKVDGETNRQRIYEIREQVGWLSVYVPLLLILNLITGVLLGVVIYLAHDINGKLDNINQKLDAMETKRVESSLAEPQVHSPPQVVRP